jgi:hypothetical protein
MNTVKFNPATGDILGFASGVTQSAGEGIAVLYTEKNLSDLAGLAVLEGLLVPRMSVEFVESGKATYIDKVLFWKDHRAVLLSESDYMMLPDVGDAAFQERAKVYRQQLRDLPNHANWPNLTLANIPAKPNPNALQLSVL